jgi:uncharacterized protein YbaR (Trm112 family)
MNDIKCPICANPLSVRMARGRRSNKPFIMLICPMDGRHFRGFITDQGFINQILSPKGENPTKEDQGGVGGGV